MCQVPTQIEAPSVAITLKDALSRRGWTEDSKPLGLSKIGKATEHIPKSRFAVCLAPNGALVE